MYLQPKRTVPRLVPVSAAAAGSQVQAAFPRRGFLKFRAPVVVDPSLLKIPKLLRRTGPANAQPCHNTRGCEEHARTHTLAAPFSQQSSASQLQCASESESKASRAEICEGTRHPEPLWRAVYISAIAPRASASLWEQRHSGHALYSTLPRALP